jgi:hypothetical protein
MLLKGINETSFSEEKPGCPARTKKTLLIWAKGAQNSRLKRHKNFCAVRIPMPARRSRDG